jgi:3-oxoacyl-[acyl-carrier-protein] synthase II
VTRSAGTAQSAGLADRPAVTTVLSGWAVTSPIGEGASFGAALRAGHSAVTEPDQQRWPVPQPQAAVVPGFDVRAALGPKGTRSMDRATGLAVTTVGRLLDEAAGLDRQSPIGLVLGTGTGSVQSMMDFTRDSFTGVKPFHVDPAQFPSTVMNCAAGQCAIWHGLRGPNTTIAGGRVAGLLALRYAQRLQRGGHVDTVLCGAVEEFSVQRSWLEWHSRGEQHRTRPLGEGCAVFLLERPELAAGQPVAEVLAIDFGVHSGPDARPTLDRCLRRVLATGAVSPSQVSTVALSVAEPPLDAAELAAVHDALPGAVPSLLRVDEAIGDTTAASAAFQVVAALAVTDPGRCALVTSMDRDGGVGAALLRVL